MPLYSVRDWAKCFENNRTRELKKLDWIPVPNKHDGDGFTDLMGRPDGPAIFGAWVLILQLASKCDPRGTLSRQNPAGGCEIISTPHTAASISRITRCPVAVIQKALDVCVEIGWLVAITSNSEELENPAGGCGIKDGTIPQEGAVVTRASRPRREGNEGNTHTPQKVATDPSRGSRFSLEAIPDQWVEFCLTDMHWQIERAHKEFATFADYYRAKSGKDARKVDWLATWRNWCRNDYRSGNGNGFLPLQGAVPDYKPGREIHVERPRD